MDAEYYPTDFQFRDPSKMTLNDAHALYRHWESLFEDVKLDLHFNDIALDTTGRPKRKRGPVDSDDEEIVHPVRAPKKKTKGSDDAGEDFFDEDEMVSSKGKSKGKGTESKGKESSSNAKGPGKKGPPAPPKEHQDSRLTVDDRLKILQELKVTSIPFGNMLAFVRDIPVSAT